MKTIVDRNKIDAEIKSLKEKINSLLKESSENSDCKFIILPENSGDFKIIAGFDLHKYSIPKR